MSELYRYAAFISYSSKDRRFAKRLHRALEQYTIPSSLGTFDLIGRGKKNRIYPVFRDREELSAGQLSEGIEAALRASGALIVVCSPNGAASPWVQKEIENFLGLGRRARIFAIITDDAPLEHAGGGDATLACFPPAFRANTLKDAAALEPLAADARRSKDGFRNAWLKLVAGLSGVTPGQLIDRDRQRRRRRAAMSTVAAVIVAAVASAPALFAVRNSGREISAGLAEDAERASARGEHDRALRLALLAARENWFLPASPSAEPALARVVAASTLVAELRGHEGPIRAIAFSPDAALVATASDDGSVRLWNVRDGSLRRSLEHARDAGAVWGIAFSRRGSRLASVGEDGNVRLWSVEDGSQTWRDSFGHGPVRDLAVAPQGGLLAVASADGHVGLWTLDDARPDQPPERVAEWRAHDMSAALRISLAFSSDGRRLITVNDREPDRGHEPIAKIWDVARRRLVASLQDDRCAGSRPTVRATEFVADASHVVTVGGMGVCLWNAETGAFVTRFESPDEAYFDIAMDPRGAFAVAGGEHSAARVWNLQSFAQTQVLSHAQPGAAPRNVRSVDVSHDGLWIATGGRDLTARVWREGDVEEPAREILAGHMDSVGVVSFAPAPTGMEGPSPYYTIATGSDDRTARLWRFRDHRVRTVFEATGDPTRRNTTIAFGPRSNNVALGTSVGDIHIFDAEGRHARRLTVRGAGVRALVYHPDGVRLASIDDDGVVRIWNTLAQSPPTELEVRASPADAIRFDASGARFYFLGADGSIVAWDVEGGRRDHTSVLETDLHELASRRHPALTDADVRILAYSGDGSRMALGSAGGHLCVWEVETLREVACGELEAEARMAAFDASSTRIAVAVTRSRVARIFDAETLEQLGEAPPSEADVSSLAFSPSGSRLATGDELARIVIRDVNTLETVGTLTGHQGEITGLAFDVDGNRLYSSGDYESLGVWRVRYMAGLSDEALVRAACGEKLVGNEQASSLSNGREGRLSVRRITVGDMQATRFLSNGDVGRDVCEGLSLGGYVARAVGWLLRPRSEDQR